MKETLERLRQSRCLPFLSVLLSFLLVWTGETGSYAWGGLCILLSLPLLAVPEYLLVPLFAAVLLENNCNILPGLTASRCVTLLFLAVQGISVLIHERPEQWLRRFAYPAVLALYFVFSSVFIGHRFVSAVFTLCMNIALAVLTGSLTGERRAKVWKLLPWSCTAFLTYLLYCLNFREIQVISGRYWLLGTTNVNDIGMCLAQTSILLFVFIFVQTSDRKGARISLGWLCAYALCLYLLVLTGSRSALLGLVGGCAVLGILLLRRSEKGRGRRRQTAMLAVICCFSAVLCLTAPRIQQQAELWKFDAVHSQPTESTGPEAPGTDPTGAPPSEQAPTREETEAELRENTDSYWQRMNPFDAYWGKSAGRTQIWSTLLEYAIKPHPLFGAGFGNAVSVLQAHATRGSGAHNILIAVLSDLGLVGLLLLAVPLFCILIRLLRRKTAAALLPLGLIVTALFNGIGENIYTERFFWLAVGLALWLLRPAATEAEEQKENLIETAEKG